MVFAFPFWNKTSTICPKLERNVTAASAPHDDSQKQRTRNTNTNNINTEYQLYTNIQIYQLYANKSFFSILKQNQNKSFQITKRCNSYCISSARWFSKTKNNTNTSTNTSNTNKIIWDENSTGIHAKNVWCCGGGYFGLKKFAEKLRKSRQNVNRDKSA